MSTSDFTDSAWWGEKPVARRVADARARGRVVVTGTIVSAGTIDVGGCMSLSCVLTDGTGEIGLLFLGRPAVAGLLEGARCTVEGTATMESKRLVLWNPLYRLEFSR
jgi:hypothetical protein